MYTCSLFQPPSEALLACPAETDKTSLTRSTGRGTERLPMLAPIGILHATPAWARIRHLSRPRRVLAKRCIQIRTTAPPAGIRISANALILCSYLTLSGRRKRDKRDAAQPRLPRRGRLGERRARRGQHLRNPARKGHPRAGGALRARDVGPLSGSSGDRGHRDRASQRRGRQHRGPAPPARHGCARGPRRLWNGILLARPPQGFQVRSRSTARS